MVRDSDPGPLLRSRFAGTNCATISHSSGRQRQQAREVTRLERQERQHRIVSLLQDQDEPLRGDDLARQLQVTRQVVVHEIALLRAAGIPIRSTPRGYVLERNARDLHTQTVIAVRHTPAQTASELYTLVDHGLVVENVIVEHPLYGELRGALQIRSRLDVDDFLAQLAAGRAALLSTLTDGYHLHTVSYFRMDSLTKAIEALRRQSIDVRA